MSRRSGVLEFAVLGLLHDSPMHGYELRKRLNGVLGSFRAFSYGSLYPCLKQLLSEGLISETPADAVRGRRSKIVYQLTAEGKERFTDLVNETGPASWEDETFGVHFAFFARTDADVRLRILEGRRSRLEDRLANVRDSFARTQERFDTYTLELQKHGLEGVEREVRWLDELIRDERRREEQLTPRHDSAVPHASTPLGARHDTTTHDTTTHDRGSRPGSKNDEE